MECEEEFQIEAKEEVNRPRWLGNRAVNGDTDRCWTVMDLSLDIGISIRSKWNRSEINRPRASTSCDSAKTRLDDVHAPRASATKPPGSLAAYQRSSSRWIPNTAIDCDESRSLNPRRWSEAKTKELRDEKFDNDCDAKRKAEMWINNTQEETSDAAIKETESDEERGGIRSNSSNDTRWNLGAPNLTSSIMKNLSENMLNLPPRKMKKLFKTVRTTSEMAKAAVAIPLSVSRAKIRSKFA